jgi:predicted 2-oxoglutarate/Fe(II)-dependent dioxygenase YbiX
MFYIPIYQLDQCPSASCWTVVVLTANAQRWREASITERRSVAGAVDDPANAEAENLWARLLHPHFTVLAMPRHVRPMVFNRYDVGMYYHDHMDQCPFRWRSVNCV